MAMPARNPVKYLASVLVSCCFCFRVRRAKLTEHRKTVNEGLQCFFLEKCFLSLYSICMKAIMKWPLNIFLFTYLFVLVNVPFYIAQAGLKLKTG